MLPPIHVIEKQTLAAPAASITFANILAKVAAWDLDADVTSRHLVLLINAASEDAVAKRAVEITINADAGANYNHQTLTGEAAVKDADRREGLNALFEYPGLTDYPFAIPGTTYANAFGGGLLLFPHAFNALNHKVVLGLGGAVEDYVNANFGRWASNNAIDNMVLAPDAGNFATGSEVILAVVDERFCISEEILLGGDGTFTVAGIPQVDGDLFTIGYLRSDQAAASDEIYHTINDDAAAVSYFRQYLLGSAGVTAANSANDRLFCWTIGNNATANAFASLVGFYSQYREGTNDPHFITISGFHDNVAPDGIVVPISGRRGNIEPINKLHYEPNGGTNFKDGSGLWVYYVPSNRELIERHYCTVDEPEITFDNLDDFKEDFEDLELVVYARSDKALSWDIVNVSFNNDVVAANYDWQYLSGDGAVVAALRSVASRTLMLVAGDTLGANIYSGGIITIPGYAKTDRHKHYITLAGRAEKDVFIQSNRWESLLAIYKIDLTLAVGPNFMAGTYAELWGVVPLDTVIRREKDKLASGRDTLTTPQSLKSIGRAWRH